MAYSFAHGGDLGALSTPRVRRLLRSSSTTSGYISWKNSEDVEFNTLEWVDWFNNRRLLEPIGYVPPVEYEAMYYQQQMAPVMVIGVK